MTMTLLFAPDCCDDIDHVVTVSVSQLGLGLLSFFTISVGGLAIGVIYGVVTALFTKYTSHVRGEYTVHVTF